MAGDGDWQAWRGNATVDSGNARIAEFVLTNRAGRYALRVEARVPPTIRSSPFAMELFILSRTEPFI